MLSGVEDGTYTFIDDGNDDTLTLGNGTVTQTVDLGVRLVDGSVAAETETLANFDQLGIEVFLAGDDVDGVAGSFSDGDLDGRTIVVSGGTGGSFQLGSDGKNADRLEYDITDMSINSPVLNLGGVSINTRNGARTALGDIDEAIDRLSKERGSVGAVINRLQYTISFTEGAIEGVTASESTIRDADIAREATAVTRGQILSQMSTSAMRQALVPVNIAMSLLTG